MAQASLLAAAGNEEVATKKYRESLEIYRDIFETGMDSLNLLENYLELLVDADLEISDEADRVREGKEKLKKLYHPAYGKSAAAAEAGDPE